MKKLMFGLVVSSCLMGLIGCGTMDQSTKESTVESTDDSVAKENKKMEEIKTKLLDQGVKISVFQKQSYMLLERAKSIDYDYFDMFIEFNSKTGELFNIDLRLKWNIDGKDKPVLSYGVASNGNIVEEGGSTDINEMADVLESLGYSDKELVAFSKWYYENYNKEKTTETTK